MNTAPFHAGECAIQRRVGVRDRLAKLGPTVIRSYMPDQHREFFSRLPFIVIGSVDAQGQPWASVLAGPPGFLRSPTPQLLLINALPRADDPIARTLAPNAAIGLLGIEPHTRRRNRLNGLVDDVTTEGFSVRVQQSFGNCPKYIQAREAVYAEQAAGQPPPAVGAARLDAAARRLIASADTFFIASTDGAGDAQGVDVSHRGGKPGFVRVDGDATLTVPDFTGNFFFNTLGNLAVNPRAGLLFIDFGTGDLLHVSVEAEIIWDGAEVNAFAGAQRLLRFQLSNVLRAPAALALRWSPAGRCWRKPAHGAVRRDFICAELAYHARSNRGRRRPI